MQIDIAVGVQKRFVNDTEDLSVCLNLFPLRVGISKAGKR
jgi:hypothetical protein